MSKRQRNAAASIHAITKGHATPRKLPDVVKIRESQATALAVLLPEQARLRTELQKVDQRINNVVAEFDGDYGLNASDMNRYQLAGNEIVLVKPQQQEAPPAPEATEPKQETPAE